MGNNESGKRDRAESHYRSTLDGLGEHLRLRRIELGITQEDMASISGLKQWDISRIEGGKFSRDPAVLRLIAQGYRFDEQHILEVVFGFKPETNYYNPLLVAYRLHEQQMYHLRTGGHPQFAIGQGLQVVTGLRQSIRQTRSPDTTVSEELGDSLVAVLTELGWAYSETSGSRENWLARSRFIQLLNETYEEFGFPELAGLVYVFQADSSYVGERYRESVAYGEEALKSITDFNLRLQLHTTMAMNWAYLEDDECYVASERTIWKLLNENQHIAIETVGGVVQRLMRGAVMLDMPDDARKASNEGKRLLKGIKREGMSAPLRKLQLIRAELERANHFKSKKSDALLQAGAQAHRFAKKHYPRLAAQIQDALDT